MSQRLVDHLLIQGGRKAGCDRLQEQPRLIRGGICDAERDDRWRRRNCRFELSHGNDVNVIAQGAEIGIHVIEEHECKAVEKLPCTLAMSFHRFKVRDEPLATVHLHPFNEGIVKGRAQLYRAWQGVEASSRFLGNKARGKQRLRWLSSAFILQG